MTMSANFIAKSSTTIDAPISKVWDALINPSVIKKYMFGTEVISDWNVNSPIIWQGIWKDKPYQDKGVILQIIPEQLLQYSHFSPLSGEADLPENYHTMTYHLKMQNNVTEILLTQDNNDSEEEQQHSQQMWDAMLVGLKKLLEN